MAKKSKKNKLRSLEQYKEKADLETWHRFMRLVGEDVSPPSKTQCKKAMRNVHINICDLYDAVRDGTDVPRFPSRRALIKYSRANRRIASHDDIETNSPMASLLVCF